MIISGVRIIPRGDREKSDTLIPEGYRVMLILENMMRMRKLNQLTVRMEPYPGAMITCSKVFGMRTMIIDTVTDKRVSLPEEKICICNCNLSEGWILKVQDQKINEAQLYTVMACNSNGRAYRRHENILASDFTLYEVAQKVLLVPYNAMAYLCCSAPSGATGCSPTRSQHLTEHEDWRTTYRVLPWCALNVPKLVDKSRWNHG